MVFTLSSSSRSTWSSEWSCKPVIFNGAESPGWEEEDLFFLSLKNSRAGASVLVEWECEQTSTFPTLIPCDSFLSEMGSVQWATRRGVWSNGSSTISTIFKSDSTRFFWLKHSCTTRKYSKSWKKNYAVFRNYFSRRIVRRPSEFVTKWAFEMIKKTFFVFNLTNNTATRNTLPPATQI